VHLTQHIRRRQATNFAPALRHAARIGRPLNRFVTINFSLLGLSFETASERFGALRNNYFCPWYRRAGPKNMPPEQAAFVWVIENTGHTAAHWLVYIPAARLEEFAAKLAKWLAKVTGAPIVDGVIDIKDAYNPYGARLYMLKGIDPACASRYAINPVPQGLIKGKRLGYSNRCHLQRAARPECTGRRCAKTRPPAGWIFELSAVP
jgi:hypothetical protein